jgi:hypothetical protein
MHDKDQLPAKRASVLTLTVLFVSFSTLAIDGFPAGSETLREFGARLTNFFLLAALAVFMIEWLSYKSRGAFSFLNIVFALVVVVGIPAINIPVTLLQNDVPPAGPMSDWIRQYAMFLWALVSYRIWMRLLRDVSSQELAFLACVGSILPLIAFFADISGNLEVRTLLGAIRGKLDYRASGLATEPALYAAWVAFSWPLVMLYSIRARSHVKRILGTLIWLALWFSAYLSNARTIAVIALMQIGYFLYWVVRNKKGLIRLRALAIAGVCSIAVIGAFAHSLTTLNSIEAGSNLSRIGSTVTSVRVSMAHPFFGIGVGQLRYFFGAYAPDFALTNVEIITRSLNAGDFRASSFNLFVRLVCEFGLAMGLIFSFVVIRPIVKAARTPVAGAFLVFATLSALGGVGFWLSADQFGYEPGILSLAILSKALGSVPSISNPPAGPA